jgi:predicted Zn-dependent peptidase
MIKRILSLCLLSAILFPAFSQTYSLKTQKDENGYQYETVEGDPTETRIYTLKNGMKVYLSVFRDKPKVFTLIPVRAGSKNDPSDNTGLAHYLEHMVFKGTSQIGSKDYKKEKVLLDSIERMFNRYRKIKDVAVRNKIYKQIDKVSLEASKYAIANEYDKLIGQLGGQGTNAFTSLDQTVYMNTIPSNQLEKWLEIEKERFGELVPRLFHTELEAVYEEKNGSLDDDNSKVYEALFAGLFKKHPYGTQTTIGTVEHLKNPSITEIKKYFNRYYVPNNMAVCMAGDLDPARTIRMIDNTLGKLVPKELPVFNSAREEPISGPIIKKVIGPSEEQLTIGFRLAGYSSRDAIMMELIDQMLSNSQAGLIDLNLNQKQKVLSASSYAYVNKDYSMHILSGSPREGQSLAEVRKLILAQLDSIKLGKFEDWLVPAIYNNYKISKLRDFDNNQNRAYTQMNAFIMGTDWASVWNRSEVWKTVTKAEIMEFVKTHYNQNYVCVEKLTGKDTKVSKISKPSITPVALNKDANSDFAAKIKAMSSPEIEPSFVDFNKEMQVFPWKSGSDILYKHNSSTPIFNLTYVVKAGSSYDPKYDLAARLMDYCGADKLSGADFKKELFKLGSEISISGMADETYISVSGLQENFGKSMQLLESLLQNPVAEPSDLKSMKDGILKERQNLKIDKGALLYNGLLNYARFGNNSPLHHAVKNKELESVGLPDLLELCRNYTRLPHRILYYGPQDAASLQEEINRLHAVPAEWKITGNKKEYAPMANDSNKVYWLDYDMVQTDLYFLSRSVPYDSSLHVTSTLFNDYMGGNMSSVVFQELRESKALAYSAYAGYSQAAEKGKYNQLTSFIGCQADKLPEAMTAMMAILEDMPLKESSLNLSKESILNAVRSDRTTKSGVLYAYMRNEKLGLHHDLKKDVFEKIPGMSLEDLKKFHASYVKGKKYSLVMIGKKDIINFEALRKFGKVTELKPEDVFPY